MGNGWEVGSGRSRKSFRWEMTSPWSKVEMVNMERITWLLWIAVTQLMI